MASLKTQPNPDTLLILTATGASRGQLPSNQRFMAEFSFAAFTWFISYFSSLAICYFKHLTFGWFVSIAIPLWAFSLWFFIRVRS